MQEPMRKFWAIVGVSLLLLLTALAIVYPLLRSQTADVRAAAKYYECRNRLKNISNALAEFVNEQGDVPRNKNGDFVLDPLVCSHSNASSHCLPETATRCTASANSSDRWTGFVWNNLTLEDAKKLFQTGQPLFVIVCHDTEHFHVHNRWRVDKKSSRPVLLSDGSLRHLNCSDEDYRVWLHQHFLAKDPALPKHLTNNYL